MFLTLAPLLEHFRLYERSTAGIQVDGQFISDGTLARCVTIVNVELNRFIHTQ